MPILRNLRMLTKMIQLTVLVLWRTLTTAYAPYNKYRSMRRIVGNSLFRYTMKLFSVAELRAQAGSTLHVYKAWAAEARLPVIIDEIGGDPRLLWVGPRRLERVVLVAHGGGFTSPADPAHFLFWNHARLELEKKGIAVGVVLLNYSLWPEATFPTQLSQLRRAVQYLIDVGVRPSHLQLAGDSAGGNLVLQLLSHLLHPHPAVDALVLTEPIRAAILFSPWAGMLGETAAYDENASLDWVPKESYIWSGEQISPAFTKEDWAFAEPYKAPEDWFDGADKVVGGVLATVGESECLRDDILLLGEKLKRWHPKVEVVLQPGGVHVDMLLDFAIGEKKLGMLTPLILDRLVAGYS